MLNRRNIGINVEINCTYVNLGPLLHFLFTLDHFTVYHFMAILYGFLARCLFGVVFKAKQGR